MYTPTTGGPCENDNPQINGKKKTAKRRPSALASNAKRPAQWCSMTRNLPCEALAFACANSKERKEEAAAAPSPAAEQPTETAAPPMQWRQLGLPTAAPPKRRRNLTLLTSLPHLPAGFTKATDRIGATARSESYAPGVPGRPERPLVDVVCFGPKEDMFSLITRDPADHAGKKTVKFGNKYTPAQKMRAAEYSRVEGYHTEGARLAPHRTAPPQPNRALAGRQAARPTTKRWCATR